MARFQVLISRDLSAKDKFTIGRDPGCNIVLSDPAVSSLHAEIFDRNGRLYIKDCNSKNGVFINRRKITEETLLQRGDIITLGDSILIPEDLTNLANGPALQPSALLPTRRLGEAVVHRELEALLFMARQLQRDLSDMDGLLKDILQIAVGTLQCEAGYIEYGQAEEKRMFSFSRGRFQPDPAKLQIDQEISAALAGDGEPVMRSATDKRTDIADSQEPASLICAAFHDREKRICGLICLYNQCQGSFFQDKDADFMKQLAGLSSLILQNAGLLAEVENEKRRAEENVVILNRQPGVNRFFIGKTKTMIDLKRKIDRLAAVPSNVLITGETGVGKGMVARLIHQQSVRARKPFISQNCAGIPDDLIESALFGHMKGAFTHAVADQEGLFELAHGGTLFLDEIGDLSLKSQAKILSVIEERVVRRLGGKKDIPVDIRLVCASHKNLAEMAEAGQFRQDLLYRLQVAVLDIPPLRMRKQDIPYLAQCFLDHFRQEMPNTPLQVAPEALTLLQACDWPGNLRQLRNVIESAIIWSDGRVLQPADLPDVVKGKELRLPTWEGMEKEYVNRVLQVCRNNISQAARMMAMDRTTVYEKMKKYGLER